MISYPNEEARLKAMELAMQTEKDFLDYVKSLQIAGSRDQSDDDDEEEEDFFCGDEEEVDDDDDDRDTIPETPAHNELEGELDEDSSSNATNKRQQQAKKRQSQSPSKSNNPQVGLDQLDNLCKLMEELTSLRDQNSKLQRRVQYLEANENDLLARQHHRQEQQQQHNNSNGEMKKNCSLSSVSSGVLLSAQNSPEISKTKPTQKSSNLLPLPPMPMTATNSSTNSSSNGRESRSKSVCTVQSPGHSTPPASSQHRTRKKSGAEITSPT